MTDGKTQCSPTRGRGAAIKWLRDRVKWSDDIDCLIWPYARNSISGYGSVGFNGRMYYAHRFMCLLACGPAPTPEHETAHSCGRGKDGCVNPNHLSWKTKSENMLDKRRHGTANNPPAWGQRGKLTEEQVAEIRATTGPKTVPALAAKFGVTESNIRHIQSGRSWKPGAQRPSNLSAEQIAAIWAARSTKPVTKIAAEYGVNRNVIDRIYRGRTFKQFRPSSAAPP